MRAGVLLLSCLAGITACGPHQARSVSEQAPIESACSKHMSPAAKLGLVTRTEFSGDAAARVLLTNAGADERRVAPELVMLCRGACDGGWASCKRHRSFSAAERARYEVALDKGESIELFVDARTSAEHSLCEKIGLFLVARVDGARTCTEAGTWIALGER